MKTIAEHIKKNEFKNVYLLYGEEAYLRHQYRDKLKEALCPEGDEMNISRFEGKGISNVEVADLAETLPFFAERRLIIIEESGWFKNGSDGFEEKLKEFPDTTFLIFVESEVDKRGKLYKTVKDLGYAAEMKTPKEKELLTWLTLQCKREGKQITESATQYLIEQGGSNMNMLQMELEKVLSYAIGAEEIRLEDVQEVCSNQAENQIFEMLDAIGNQNREKALTLYHDLLTLREPAMRILYLLTRQIHILLQVSEMTRLNMDNGSIASKAGIPPFTVGKYKSQIGHFSYSELVGMLEKCQDVDAGIKRGRYQDVIGVELLIVEFSTKKSFV
ncbi:MAG: DNA polymerase III subunit delta [Lachnospiraceae bacterium]|nr:DNA polymerase III subunit delta [Lachnospiraceae bacterium]